MPLQTQILIHAVTCDKRQCVARLNIPRPEWTFYSDEFKSYMRRRGWSRWVSRSDKYFCPDHGPSSPNMRRVI